MSLGEPDSGGRSPLNLALRRFMSMGHGQQEQLLVDLGVYEKPAEWDYDAFHRGRLDALGKLREADRLAEFMEAVDANRR